VIDDMLGLFTEFTPKFVKRYRRLGDGIRAAAREYAEEVRQGRFPAARAHLFAVDGDTRITSVKPTPQMVQRR
jgi:3-methyl-2-oxobutanoate hydroxymethyltransferase